MPDHQRSLTSLEIIERRFNELTAQPTGLSLDGRVIGFGPTGRSPWTNSGSPSSSARPATR